MRAVLGTWALKIREFLGKICRLSAAWSYYGILLRKNGKHQAFQPSPQHWLRGWKAAGSAWMFFKLLKDDLEERELLLKGSKGREPYLAWTMQPKRHLKDLANFHLPRTLCYDCTQKRNKKIPCRSCTAVYKEQKIQRGPVNLCFNKESEAKMRQPSPYPERKALEFAALP